MKEDEYITELVARNTPMKLENGSLCPKCHKIVVFLPSYNIAAEFCGFCGQRIEYKEIE